MNFRQTAMGIMLGGSSFWIAVHVDGPNAGVPEFQPASQARVIETFKQDSGKSYWRWAGSLTGNGTVVRLSRGQSVDVFLPGDFDRASLRVANWQPGDWDFSNVVNSADISAFLSAWGRSVADGTKDGDFNLDGTVNSADISAFLEAWVGGF